MGSVNSVIAARFAKLESWFAGGPEGKTKGLLLPKSQSGQVRRLEQRLRVTLNRGSSARPPYSEVWGALRVKMKWKEATYVRFFTAEIGGQEIANEDVLPKDSFKPKAENVYEASIWYEGNLTQEQIAQMSQSGNTPKVTIQMNFVVEGNDKPICWTGTLLPVQIEEVSFGGTKYWELKSDDAATTYSAPQWKDVDGNGKPTNTAQGERDYAVAFTRNTNPKIGAKFKIASASNFGAVKIKATGPGGVAIPETAATVAGDVVTLPLTEASAALVNTIKFYDKKDDAKAFKLEWEVKIGNSDWSKIGASKHTVYVLFADPITPLRQETLADLGCRNANEENAETSARDKMYGEFTDRVVKRLDGKQMTYWLNDQMGCTDTADLLSRADGNGNCQSWSGLFRDILQLQGIQADRIRVGPQANDTSVAVQTWTFTEPPHGPANHPYVIGTDATDAQGVPGQGNPNPPGSFNGHWITESEGTYFDPSYGAAAVSGANKGKLYEDSAFAGFGATYEIPNNGGQFDGIRKNNTSAQSPAEVGYFEAN